MISVCPANNLTKNGSPSHARYRHPIHADVMNVVRKVAAGRIIAALKPFEERKRNMVSAKDDGSKS